MVQARAGTPWTGEIRVALKGPQPAEVTKKINASQNNFMLDLDRK